MIAFIWLFCSVYFERFNVLFKHAEMDPFVPNNCLKLGNVIFFIWQINIKSESLKKDVLKSHIYNPTNSHNLISLNLILHVTVFHIWLNLNILKTKSTLNIELCIATNINLAGICLWQNCTIIITGKFPLWLHQLLQLPQLHHTALLLLCQECSHCDTGDCHHNFHLTVILINIFSSLAEI